MKMFENGSDLLEHSLCVVSISNFVSAARCLDGFEYNGRKPCSQGLS